MDKFNLAVEAYQRRLEKDLEGEHIGEMLLHSPLKNQYYFGVDENGKPAVRFFKSTYINEEIKTYIQELYHRFR